MLKNYSRLDHKIGEKNYQFSCDMDSPLNEVKDALFQFLKYIMDIENQLKIQKEEMDKAKDLSPAEEPEFREELKLVE